MKSAGRDTPRRIRQGQVYWLDDCEPLDGDVSKRRRVLVFTPTALLDAGQDPIVVVGISSTVSPSEADRVSLPNRRDNPDTKSGLDKPCWAVPRWYFPVERLRLGELAGFVRGETLKRVIEAVVARMDEGA